MKKALFVSIAVIISMVTFCQTGIKSESLLTIGKGESFLVSESSAGMICNNGELCVTVYNSSTQNFFVYNNGIKNGPFKKNQIGQNMCKGELLKDGTVYNNYDDEETENKVEITDEGYSVFVFNGKKYGPFAEIINSFFSDNNKSFVAVCINNEMKPVVISNLCPEFTVKGNVENVVFNKAGSKFLLTSKSASEIDEIINEKIMSLSGSDITEEEIMKISQEISDLQNNASADATMSKAVIYTETGKTYGPYNSDNLYGDNPCFAYNSQNNWTMILGSVLYINGSEVKDFGEDYPSNNKIFLSADATKYAVQFYNKMVLWDGSEYPYPVYAGYCSNSLVWLSLKNETQLVKYSLPF